jgi:aryl-alcohol dehydrogenase
MFQVIDAVAAIVNERGGQFALEPVLVGPLGADEVLVEIVACGICHTDLAVRDQRRSPSLPAVLGHEGAGIVRSIGAAVRSVRTNDRVVLSYLSCGECAECRGGRTASCAKLGPLCFAGCRADGSHAVCGRDGKQMSDRFFGQSSLATWAVANERNLVIVPSDLPLELMAPLGCGIQTGAGAVWNELGVTPGASFAVFGAGGVGLSALLAARVAKAGTIVAIDRVASRLELASQLGATHVIDASKVEDVPAVIRSMIGDGVSFALDTTGAADVIGNAYRALRQRGTLGLVATASQMQTLVLPQLDLMTGCRRVMGIIEGGGSAYEMIPRMLELYRAGHFAFDRLITFYDFENINQAVADCESGVAVKPVLHMR